MLIKKTPMPIKYIYPLSALLLFFICLPFSPGSLHFYIYFRCIWLFFRVCPYESAEKSESRKNTSKYHLYFYALYQIFSLQVHLSYFIFFLTDIKKLQIADGRNLRFDRSIKVFKRGGTTGETEGYLSDNSLSVCLDFTNGFYFFDRCYAVESINSPFFEPGDSGSGVFLIENGVPTKPLGIAFAFQKRSQTTAVCRIDKIIDAFNLSVYQYEEESMET